MSFFSDLFGKLPDLATGGLASGISGLFSSIFQGQSQARQQKYSKELMAYQAALQAKYQENLLRNQMPLQVASMKAAGLNPATVNGLTSAVSAPSPSATSPSPSSFQSNIASDMLAIKQSEIVDSEINLKNKEARYYEDLSAKTRSETDMLDNQNVVFFDNMQRQWDNLISSTQLNKSNTLLADERKKEVTQSIENLKMEENKLLSEIAKNYSDVTFTRKQSKYYDSYIMSVIKQQFASAALSLGTNQREAEMMVYNMVNSDAMTAYYKDQSALLKANEELSEFSLKMEKRYGNAQKIVDIVSKVFGAAGTALGGAAGAFFGVRTLKGISKAKGVR